MRTAFRFPRSLAGLPAAVLVVAVLAEPAIDPARGPEPLFQADVVSARPVQGPADPRCLRELNPLRCAAPVAGAPPAYWEVTYLFRGQQHQLRMGARPGATLTVNQRGEARGAAQ